MSGVSRPTAPDGALAILAEVAMRFTQGAAAIEAGGVSWVGFRRPSLRNALSKGWLEQLDTGDPDTDGGRYRLRLTTAGHEQLRRARHHRYYPSALSKAIDVYLDARGDPAA